MHLFKYRLVQALYMHHRLNLFNSKIIPRHILFIRDTEDDPITETETFVKYTHVN